MGVHRRLHASAVFTVGMLYSMLLSLTCRGAWVLPAWGDTLRCQQLQHGGVVLWHSALAAVRQDLLFSCCWLEQDIVRHSMTQHAEADSNSIA
jgi:hypothetical protein